jgi:hypothetical protein
MTKFFRNWGGSFGIAFVNPMSERHFDFHQSIVAANLQASSRASQPRVNEAAAYVQVRALSTLAREIAEASACHAPGDSSKATAILLNIPGSSRSG